jgi:outer membrane cobalamin receptor
MHGGLESSAVTLRGTARYSREDSRHFQQSSGGPELAVLQEREHEENENLQFGLVATRALRSNFELTLDASFSDLTRDVDSPGIWADATTPLQPPSELRDEMRRGRLSLALRGAHAGMQSALGGELRTEDGSSEGEIDFVGATDFARYRRIGSVFAECLQSFEAGLTVQAALRLDASQSEQPQWSPQISLQQRLPQRARLKASYGRAFKLPSFYALSHPLIGDDSLAPERSESFDLGVVQSLTRRIDLEFTWFTTRYEDLVDYDPTIAPFGLMVNRDEVTSQGFEALARVDLPRRSSLSAQWSRAKTNVEETGEPLNERPEWEAALALDHRWAGGHSIQLRWRYVGEIPSFAYPTAEADIESYDRFDIALQLRITEQLRGTLAVENLTDVDYHEALGVPGPGILPRLGILAEF